MDHPEAIRRDEINWSTDEALDDGWGRVRNRTGPRASKLTI
jgi:hypothetical protein